MSRYRRVEVGTWTDSKVRALSAPPPNAQTLWMYLLCGPRTMAIPGVVVAREAVIADDLRWPLESLREAFHEVFQEGLAEADWEAGLIVLPKALMDSHGEPRESNAPQSPNVVKGWAKAWKEVPDSHLKTQLLQALGSYCKALPEGFTKAFAEAFRKPLESLSNTGSRKKEQEAGRRKVREASPPAPSSSSADPDAVALAERLRTHLCAQKPDRELANAEAWVRTRPAWSKQLSALLKLEGRTLERATELLAWVFGDQGGRTEYRFRVDSPKALREKWDAIDMAMRAPPRARQGHFAVTGNEKYADGEVEI